MADFPAGYAFPQSDIVFKSAIPLNELPIDGRTGWQGTVVAYFREQMDKGDEIFLLNRVKLGAIGRKEDNGSLANDPAHAVALRLRASGIPGNPSAQFVRASLPRESCWNPPV